MWNLALRSLLAGAVIGTLWVIPAASASGPEVIPPEKAAEIASARIVDPSEVDFSGVGPRVATADSGPAADVSQIRRTLPGLLRADVLLGAMPTSMFDRRSHLEKARIDRGRLVSELWAVEHAKDRATDLETGLGIAAADPGYWAFQDAEFTVLKWQGIAVAADRATITLVGAMRYRASGEGWSSEPAQQYQIILQRSVRHGAWPWVLSHKASVLLGGSGS